MNINIDPKELLIYSLQPLLKRYFWAKVRIRYHLLTKKKDIDPLDTYFVHPKEITKVVTAGNTFRVRDSGRIVGGDWDQDAAKFESHPIYGSLEQRFIRGDQWEETPQYKICREKISRGKKAWHNCSSLDDLNGRCEYIDRLYKRIESEGYKHQSDLQSEKRQEIYPKELQEVSIGISRHGNLVLIDGRHRLAIAKILGLEKIPVQIAIVHSEWNGGLPNCISTVK